MTPPATPEDFVGRVRLARRVRAAVRVALLLAATLAFLGLIARAEGLLATAGALLIAVGFVRLVFDGRWEREMEPYLDEEREAHVLRGYPSRAGGTGSSGGEFEFEDFYDRHRGPIFISLGLTVMGAGLRLL